MKLGTSMLYRTVHLSTKFGLDPTIGVRAIISNTRQPALSQTSAACVRACSAHTVTRIAMKLDTSMFYRVVHLFTEFGLDWPIGVRAAMPSLRQPALSQTSAACVKPCSVYTVVRIATKLGTSMLYRVVHLSIEFGPDPKIGVRAIIPNTRQLAVSQAPATCVKPCSAHTVVRIAMKLGTSMLDRMVHLSTEFSPDLPIGVRAAIPDTHQPALSQTSATCVRACSAHTVKRIAMKLDTSMLYRVVHLSTVFGLDWPIGVRAAMPSTRQPALSHTSAACVKPCSAYTVVRIATKLGTSMLFRVVYLSTEFGLDPKIGVRAIIPNTRQPALSQTSAACVKLCSAYTVVRIATKLGTSMLYRVVHLSTEFGLDWPIGVRAAMPSTRQPALSQTSAACVKPCSAYTVVRIATKLGTSMLYRVVHLPTEFVPNLPIGVCAAIPDTHQPALSQTSATCVRACSAHTVKRIAMKLGTSMLYRWLQSSQRSSLQTVSSQRVQIR